VDRRSRSSVYCNFDPVAEVKDVLHGHGSDDRFESLSYYKVPVIIAVLCETILEIHRQGARKIVRVRLWTLDQVGQLGTPSPFNEISDLHGVLIVVVAHWS
jgi:hypothetical protein